MVERRARARLAAVCACAATLAACVGAGRGDAGSDLRLAGRVWEVAAERFVPEAELLRTLAGQRYVLLGEVHDNPEHHRIQARVLSRLAALGRRPAVVLEMIPRDRADALQVALADPGASAEDVRRAVDWDASGWPGWESYAPIFEAALEARLVLVAGDLDARDREALRGGAGAALDPARIEALGLDAALPPPVVAALEASIREGHCDLLPEAALPPMVAFQRARDAQLARSLVDAAGPDGAVLIAGAGHVRRDAGVPFHLARFEHGAAVASVGLVEVDDPEVGPARALADRFGDSAPFDFVWFTPRTPREDPCKALERELAPSAANGRRGRTFRSAAR